MTHAAHVLIVEDDELVQGLLAALLAERGMTVTGVGSGAEMAAVLVGHHFDIVLLDLELPDEDGLVLARRLRAQSDVPIIVVTARQGREDRVAALKIGADDYIVKPFDPQELILRIDNLLSRAAPVAKGSGPVTIQIGALTLGLNEHALRRADGSTIPLTPAEFSVLSALTKAPRRVLSRNHLLDALSTGAETPGERVVDVVVSRLRKKLGDNPKSPKHIRTVTEFGYIFQPTEQPSD